MARMITMDGHILRCVVCKTLRHMRLDIGPCDIAMLADSELSLSPDTDTFIPRFHSLSSGKRPGGMTAGAAGAV
jgi:hypothetical protein